MKTIYSYLQRMSDIGKVLYYPGAGNDFETMKIFIENSTIETVYYSDYDIDLDKRDMLEKIGNGWEITEEEKILPGDLNQNTWADFWYNSDALYGRCTPEYANGSKLVLKSKTDKTVILYYLRTEAIKTYLILLQNHIEPDLLILQDHGGGGNWGTQIFGYSDDVETCLFYMNIRNKGCLPKFLFAGKNTNQWPEYDQITEYEGSFGIARHSRALFHLKTGEKNIAL